MRGWINSNSGWNHSNLFLVIESMVINLDLANITRENGMKDSMEFIVQEASKTSQVYMNQKLLQIQNNVDALKISMVFNNDYQNTKNQIFTLETKFSTVRSYQDILDQRLQEILMQLDKKVNVSLLKDELRPINHSLKKVP